MVRHQMYNIRFIVSFHSATRHLSALGQETEKYISVTRPDIVNQYNANMGGMDLMDRIISYYRISARTKKWTIGASCTSLIWQWPIRGFCIARTKLGYVIPKRT